MDHNIGIKITKFEEHLFSYVEKYDQGVLDMDGLKAFCEDLVKYFIITKCNSSAVLDAPQITYYKTDETEHASYIPAKNILKINENYLESILNMRKNWDGSIGQLLNFADENPVGLCFMVRMVGHEADHFVQKNKELFYKQLTVEQQKNVDENVRKIIKDFKNNLSLTQENVALIRKLIDPKTYREDTPPKGYETKEEYYDDVSWASYWTLSYEKEARDVGTEFALDFYQKLQQTNHNISYEQSAGVEHLLNYKQRCDNINYKTSEAIINTFSQYINISTEKILNIAESVESDNAEFMDLNILDYKTVLKVFLEDKTFDQKKSLFQNAIYNNYPVLTSMIVDSLYNDIDFKEHKMEASNFVRDCLIRKDKGELGNELSIGLTYNIEYEKILTQDDYEKLIQQTTRNNTTNAYYFAIKSNFEACSLETLLECQKHMFYSEDYVESELFNALFSKTTIQGNINYLASGQLKPKVEELLINYLKKHPEYEEYKDEINRIVEQNQTNKQEPIISNNFNAQVEHKIRTKRAEIEHLGRLGRLNIDKCLARYASMDKSLPEIFEIIDQEYNELKESFIYANNIMTEADYDCVKLEGSNDSSLTGIIGGFKLDDDTLILQTLFGNTEEGRLKLREIRSVNWPKNKNELPLVEQKEIERDAKKEYEIPAMKDSIAKLLPHLEKLTHIKDIKIESNNAFINYIQSALEDLGFQEVKRSKRDMRDIEIWNAGATKEDGNRHRMLSVPREVLIENIKQYLLTQRDKPTI